MKNVRKVGGRTAEEIYTLEKQSRIEKGILVSKIPSSFWDLLLLNFFSLVSAGSNIEALLGQII